MLKFFNQKSVIAPKYFERKNDHLILGDKLQRVYMVTQFPSEFDFGILHHAFNSNDVNVKYFYVTRPLKESMTKAITSEMRNLEQKYQKEKQDVVRQKIFNKIQDLRANVEELARSNDKTLEVLLCFIVWANNKEDLKDMCESVEARLSQIYGFKFDSMKGLQEVMFKSVIPLWKESGLIADLDYRYRLPLSTWATSVLFPFSYDDLLDKNGFLLGTTQGSHGIVKFNPFLFIEDEDEARKYQLTAGSTIVIGKTGFGKSQTLAKFATFFNYRKIRFVWIDPHNQNAKWMKKYNGKFVAFGTGDAKINPLDLRLSDQIDSTSKIDPYNTKHAIYEAIRTFKEVIRLYHKSNLGEVEKSLAVLDDIVLKTYEKKGITDESFRFYTKKDYPIIEDVYNEIKNEIEVMKASTIIDKDRLVLLNNLVIYLTPLILSDGEYFNGHTTVGFDNENDYMIGFGTVKLDSAPRNIKDAMYHLIMQFLKDVLYDSSRKCACIWDEFQNVALNGHLLPEVSDAFRSVRKYNSLLVLGMQEIGDLNTNVKVDGAVASSYGRTILNNATYKLIMHLDERAIKDVKELTRISDREADDIFDFVTGQCLMMRGSEHYYVNVYASKNEIDVLKLDS